MTTLKNKPDAVLLDWDDHLVDSQEYYARCAYGAMEKMKDLGYPLPTKPYAQKGKQKSSSYFLEAYGEENSKIVNAFYQELILDDNVLPRLKPVARELLKFLELNHIPYALVSDTVQPRLDVHVSKVLQAAGLPVPIHVGVGNGVELKPHPSGINKALELLSQQTGTLLNPSEAILMSGDRPDKDGVAANNAGISHSIIMHENSGDTKGWNTYPDLESLLKTLAQTVGKTFERPKYFKRFDYDGISREETHIITGDQDYIESPATDDLSTLVEMSPEEFKLHNQRWIAKRGKGLDGSGPYNDEQKLEAAYGVVHTLLTPKMVREIAERTLGAVEKKHAENPDSKEKITVHLPHITGSKNMLRIGMIHELTQQLNDIYTKEHPELNVEFKDGLEPGSPSIEMITIAEGLERGINPAEGKLEALTDHDIYSPTTIKRSTGSLSERMAKQCLFEFDHFKPGDLVILADDHVQAGSTFILQYQQLKKLGVDVVALASLAAIPESKNLQPHADVTTDMTQAMNYAVDNYLTHYPDANPIKIAQKFQMNYDHGLAMVGLATTNLSNREAMTMMAFLIDGTKPEQLAWFQGIMEKYGCSPDLIEREADSLKAEAMKPALTPIDFLHEMERQIPKFTSLVRS